MYHLPTGTYVYFRAWFHLGFERKKCCADVQASGTALGSAHRSCVSPTAVWPGRWCDKRRGNCDENMVPPLPYQFKSRHVLVYFDKVEASAYCDHGVFSMMRIEVLQPTLLSSASPKCGLSSTSPTLSFEHTMGGIRRTLDCDAQRTETRVREREHQECYSLGTS